MRDDLPIRSAQDIVSPEECHEAMQFLAEVGYDLRDIGDRLAIALADFGLHDRMLESVEAVAFSLSEEKSSDKRKAEARSSRAYVDRIKMIHAATIAKERLFAEREGLRSRERAAQIRVNLFQTLQANLRARGLRDGANEAHERDRAEQANQRYPDR